MPSELGKWCLRRQPNPATKGIELMLSQLASAKGARRRRGSGRRVRIGRPDPRLTGHAGVAAVTEADRVLGIADALDGAVGRLKRRDRSTADRPPRSGPDGTRDGGPHPEMTRKQIASTRCPPGVSDGCPR